MTTFRYDLVTVSPGTPHTGDYELVINSSTATRLGVTHKANVTASLLTEEGTEEYVPVRILVSDTIEVEHLRWMGCMAGNVNTNTSGDVP